MVNTCNLSTGEIGAGRLLVSLNLRPAQSTESDMDQIGLHSETLSPGEIWEWREEGRKKEWKGGRKEKDRQTKQQK